MPKILKRFLKPEADDYVFQPAEQLEVEEEPAPPEAEDDGAPEPEEKEEKPDEGASAAEKEIYFAKIQAEAILADARKDMEAWKEKTRRAFEEELESLRAGAREEGYNAGYAEGMAGAMQEGKIQREALIARQLQEVQAFLEQAAREKEKLWDAAKEEMKDLALAVAEKVIRVSLKNSSDVLLRMVDAATDTHKRCEWARIYVADCDLAGKAYTAPELTAALGHISDRVRVVPMADDESGTCIVELPDVILDASVSTQLGAIREVLKDTAVDKEEDSE